MPSSLIDATGITRRFGARTVLDAVDIRVDAGSRIGLVGPNGSGKSTLLRVLAGLESPDSGSLRVRGTSATCRRWSTVRRPCAPRS